jgi:hypothetical protein
MKNRRLIVLGIVGLVLAVGLTGCIISASPDTSKTVVVKPGEQVEFKVTAVPQSTCAWRLDDVIQPETGSTYYYKPASTDLGDHTLTVTVAGDGSRTWKIRVEQETSLTWEWVSGGSGYDYALSVQQTTDGGYIAAGTYNQPHTDGIYSADRCYVVKLDRSGNKEWGKLYGESSDLVVHGNSIRQTSDGGYIIAGDKWNNDGWAWLIIKIDSAGKIEWQSTYGNDDWCVECSKAAAIRQTSDGGYVVAGYSSAKDIPDVANHGSVDVYVVKLDASGNLEWQKMYGGSGDDRASEIQQTQEGGYIVAGYSESNDLEGAVGNGRCYLIKLDSAGSVEWQMLYGLGYGYGEGAGSVKQTLDSGYIVSGSYSRGPGEDPVTYNGDNISILKLNESGTAIWQTSLNANCSSSLQQTADGGYIIASSSESYYSSRYHFTGHLFKLDVSGNKEWGQYYSGNQMVRFFDVKQTDDGGYVVAGGRDYGIWSGFWAYGWDDQSGYGWKWVVTYLGKHDDLYVLKVGPDGEIN